MKVSLNWLRAYTPVNMTAQELADALTMGGLETDAITDRYTHLSNVIVARITATRPHPSADKLTCCDVDCGKGVIRPIVCGAPNARDGLVTACALPGATLPGGMTIKTSKLRGEVSEGMLCSGRELELNADASGIMELDTTAAPGTPLAAALHLSDYTLEIDLTPNRADCTSVIGIAREAAAFQKTGIPVSLPAVSPAAAEGEIHDKTSVQINDPEHCPRYAARLIEGVTVKPSPFWLQDRLRSVGLSPINNIVDITNFVMMELGQPLHAFDFDNLAENRIVVRTAGETDKTFTTLDSKQHTLEPGMLLICDGEKPVALAGVMGGENSEIENSTTRVLLESACFQPDSIRKTAKRLGISTDSSYRFERGVNPAGTVYALNRAAELIAELGEGELISGVIDENPIPHVPCTLTLDVPACNRRLGTQLAAETLTELLTAIEFGVTASGPDTLTVHVPPYRVDVSRPEDLSEEVARLWGYNNIQTTYPAIPAQPAPVADAIRLRNRAKDFLSGLGFAETINYSFISRQDICSLRTQEESAFHRTVAILNPLSEEQAVMRTSLIPGLLTTAARNMSMQSKDLRLMEIGNTFFATAADQLPEESEKLTLLMTGNRAPAAWLQADTPCDFFDIKGVAEALMTELRITGVRFAPPAPDAAPYLRKGYAADLISSTGDRIGVLGQVHPETAAAQGVKQAVFVMELSFDRLRELNDETREARPIPRFPSTTRDITVIVDASCPAGDILQHFTTQEEPLLENVQLLTVFDGTPIPEGKKSVSLRLTYRSSDKTLKDKVVNALHTKLAGDMIRQFKAELPL